MKMNEANRLRADPIEWVKDITIAKLNNNQRNTAPPSTMNKLNRCLSGLI